MRSLLSGTFVLFAGMATADSNIQTITLHPAGEFHADAVTAAPTAPPMSAPFSPQDQGVRCISGIPIVDSVPTPAIQVREYLAENDIARPFKDCSLTAPASLTSGLASYQVELSSWLGTVENPTITVSDLCGQNVFQKSHASFCTECFTVFASANGTAASASTVLPAMKWPGGNYLRSGRQSIESRG